jgi:glutaminyl-tRNA synthetase
LQADIASIVENRFQFERVGYFSLDPDSTPNNLVFNRTLPLKDSWAKIEKKSLLHGADAR